jgi:hypothetical protein
MQNKPNFQKTQMNTTPYLESLYKKFTRRALWRANPIQTQFKANSNPSAAHQSQNKPNPNPISVPQNSPMVYNAAEIYKELLK